MSIKRLIPGIILLLLLVASCGTTGNALPTAGNGTSHPLANPPTQPSLTTPPSPHENLVFQCLPILASVPNSLRISGQIILRDYRRTRSLFALDPSNGQTTEILRSSGSRPLTIAAVSPDRQLLAYLDRGSSGHADGLVIVDSDFVTLKAISCQTSWLDIENWLNNQQLALFNLDPETSMVIFDWITSQEMPISFNQFPDFSNSVRHPWVEFDPTMQLVLYQIEGNEYSLFDLTSKKSVATLPAWTAKAPDASWSVDGGFVAVTGPSPKYYDNRGGSDEIFAISRNGQVEQVTHLADYYGRGLGLYSPRWSPDGKQLAFWVQHEANGTLDHVLAIVDTTTKTTTNFCISSDPSGYGGEFDESLPAPIWSPDGKQIIVENRFSHDHNRVVLVDLPNKIAVEIAQDARPVGWMAAQP